MTSVNDIKRKYRYYDEYTFGYIKKDGVKKMQLEKKIVPEDEDSINLVTTLLIRYPQLCTINYSPKGHLLKLSFILKKDLDLPILKKFQDELISCIRAYSYFERKEEPRLLKIAFNRISGLTNIEITRDASTLTQKEISLIVTIMNDSFPKILVSDEITVPEDELSEQDDFIRYMLDNLRVKSPANKLIALREEGRVLVFKR